MASWVWRMLPRNVRSLATSSENQRVEDYHCHHEAFGYFLTIQTRWQVNDQYEQCRVNNAVYYSYLDTYQPLPDQMKMKSREQLSEIGALLITMKELTPKPGQGRTAGKKDAPGASILRLMTDPKD